MIWTVSSVGRLLALLSQTMGNLDQAAAHFEDTLAFCRKAGFRPELAWTCCDSSVYELALALQFIIAPGILLIIALTLITILGRPWKMDEPL